jgi:3'-phosphoadenosine 5'-phosphosulfate sulfotransferase (PAPS reductase)/FAD synthetase
MGNKLKHVLGISGGKDSAALAIYLKNKYPSLDIEYYSCDTGKELDETYKLIENLEVYLGKKIKVLKGAEDSHVDPFDHFHQSYGGYLPSSNSRWCTKKLKLEPFESYVGDTPVVSYVGIRGDEDREGYISKKSNIQSIFPFRQNIWSEDVVGKVLKNSFIEELCELYKGIVDQSKINRILGITSTPISPRFKQADKLKGLLELDTVAFNYVVWEYLKTTSYPLASETNFPLVENNDILIREDIFTILRESGVGVPKYYEKVAFESNGKKGEYARSRSGCYFCFYQQKIEWVWLYEQHPDRFQKAMEYEKDGYTWMQDERLDELIKPERIAQIKEDFIKKTEKLKANHKSPYLLDILDDTEGEGCASCFV